MEMQLARKSFLSEITFRVSTRCQFALADFCARHSGVCCSACHGLLCVFRDGGFLHRDLRNASALPGGHTQKQQWPVLLRRVTDLSAAPFQAKQK